MTLLSLALLIQILYYIIQDAHHIILLFILLSLMLLTFSKNENIFLLVPMILSHAVHTFYKLPPLYEGFKKGLKNKVGKVGKAAMQQAVKPAMKNVVKPAAKAACKAVKKAPCKAALWKQKFKGLKSKFGASKREKNEWKRKHDVEKAKASVCNAELKTSKEEGLRSDAQVRSYLQQIISIQNRIKK